MTLLPTDTRDVRGVPATRYKINAVCAHPDCTEQSEPGAHHCFRRSAQIGDSYFVSIDGGEPVPHAVGLCREHHRQITDNQAWIRLEHDVHGAAVFSWADEDGQNEDGTKQWQFAGDLDPQPGQLSKTVKAKPKLLQTEKAERRPSQVMSIRCPKDAAENGIQLLRDLLKQCGDIIPHREPDDPPYFILMDALNWFVDSYSASSGQQSKMSSGKSSELLAATKLMEIGSKVAIPVVDDSGVDIVANYRTKVQVKSKEGKDEATNAYSFKLWSTSKENVPADVFILHARTEDRWWIIPRSHLASDQQMVSVTDGGKYDQYENAWHWFAAPLNYKEGEDA